MGALRNVAGQRNVACLSLSLSYYLLPPPLIKDGISFLQNSWPISGITFFPPFLWYDLDSFALEGPGYPASANKVSIVNIAPGESFTESIN